MYRSLLNLGLLVALFSIWSVPTKAASTEECETYANAAMAQIQENARAGYGLSGGNWSSDRNAHRDWCLQHTVSEVNGAWEFRENELKGRRCETYASAAMNQVQENTRLACGLAGGNWSTDRNAHLQWCLQNPANFNAEWEFRQRELDQCKSRPSTPAGGGNERIVAQPTDIYDSREGNATGASLRAGAKVTTVGVCGDDWCELSRPKGWIWGGHLQ